MKIKMNLECGGINSDSPVQSVKGLDSPCDIIIAALSPPVGILVPQFLCRSIQTRR